MSVLPPPYIILKWAIANWLMASRFWNQVQSMFKTLSYGGVVINSYDGIPWWRNLRTDTMIKHEDLHSFTNIEYAILSTI